MIGKIQQKLFQRPRLCEWDMLSLNSLCRPSLANGSRPWHPRQHSRTDERDMENIFPPARPVIASLCVICKIELRTRSRIDAMEVCALPMPTLHQTIHFIDVLITDSPSDVDNECHEFQWAQQIQTAQILSEFSNSQALKMHVAEQKNVVLIPMNRLGT